MVVDEGAQGLFKGNWTNVLRIMPHSAIELFSFEVYKKVMTGLTPLGVSQKQQSDNFMLHV